MDKSENLRSTVYGILDVDIVFNIIQRKVMKVTDVIYIIQVHKVDINVDFDIKVAIVKSINGHF